MISMESVSNKYVTATLEDRVQILNVFDSVRNSLEIHRPENVVLTEIDVAASITQELIQETGLPHVNKRTIMRLHHSRGVILQKRGRKINIDLKRTMGESNDLLM